MTARRKKVTPMPERPKEAPKHKRAGAVLADDLETLQVMKDALAAAVAAEKAARAEFEAFEQYVVDRMAFERVPKQSTDNRTYYISHQAFAKVQDKDAFISWALENDPELLDAYRVKQGDLNTAVRRSLDDEVDLPPGVGYHYVTKVNSRAR